MARYQLQSSLREDDGFVELWRGRTRTAFHLSNCRLLLPLALVCDCFFSTFWRAMCCLGCFVITCLQRLLVLYDFVLLLPLEMLSLQTLQQALLSLVAFTTKYSQITLEIHLPIVSHRNVNMCSLMQTHMVP